MTTTAYVNAQAVFYQQYEHVRRDEVVGILLALFLGGFGIHHFYLRRTGLGILYACFCWTPFPWVMGFIECFFMPGRVREFNAIQAAGIAAALGISMPAYGQPINVTVNVPPGAATAYAGTPAPSPYTPVTPFAEPGTLVACTKCQKTNVGWSEVLRGVRDGASVIIHQTGALRTHSGSLRCSAARTCPASKFREGNVPANLSRSDVDQKGWARGPSNRRTSDRGSRYRTTSDYRSKRSE